MKLLVLSPVHPDAPSDGDRVRLYHWLKALAQGNQVQLLAFGDPSRPADAAILQGRGTGSPVAVTLVASSAWSRRWAALLRLGSALPATVSSAASSAMRQAVDRAIAQAQAGGEPYDAVLCYRLKMAPYALRFRGPRFLDYTDSLTRYQERRAVAARLAGRPLQAAWARRQARQLAAYEAFCAGQFNAGYFNSRQDRDAVAAMAPARAARLQVAANGVALSAPPAKSVRPQGAKIAFIGHLAYPPNADAVAWFAREVLPLLGGRPAPLFEVAGGDAPARLRALDRDPRLRFVGPVPDPQAFLRGARLSVCPVFTGAGRQNKLLESFAAGVPAVASPMAAAGAEARDGRDLLVAESPQDFALAVQRLLDDPALGARLARGGRALLKRLYRWDANAAGLQRSLRLGMRPPLW